MFDISSIKKGRKVFFYFIFNDIMEKIVILRILDVKNKGDVKCLTFHP